MPPGRTSQPGEGWVWGLLESGRALLGEFDFAALWCIIREDRGLNASIQLQVEPERIPLLLPS